MLYCSEVYLDKRKEDVIFVAIIEKCCWLAILILHLKREGRHIPPLDARLNALENKQDCTFSKKKVTSKIKIIIKNLAKVTRILYALQNLIFYFKLL